MNDLDKMFRLDLAMICESHHKDDIGEFNKYRVNNVYGNSKQEKVNLNYSKSWAISEGRYLMRPLLPGELSNERMEPIDENILTQRMAKLKCIVLENQGQREVVSAEEVYNMEEVNIFESKMTQAAEYLLKDNKK